jgi:hypothetical protein
MNRSGGRSLGLLILGVLLVISGSTRAIAADSERRDFNILVDGKRAGAYHLTIAHADDGTHTVTAQAHVRVSYLVYTYTYSYQGTEVWKDGRLTRLTSSTDDDGKRFQVGAVADGTRLRVKVNGQEHTTRPDVWTTTYWRLPDAKFRNHAVPLLDADTGRDINATLQCVGDEAIRVGAQALPCVHYRVTGDGLEVDAWYDAQEHLVRQESVEDGHRTVLDLAGIRR